MFNSIDWHNFINKGHISKGFTLIELIVTLAIMSLIMFVTLGDGNRFESKITFKNMAYMMAMSIREMQTYGVNNATSDSTDAGYGIYINRDEDNKKYYLFKDSDQSKKYDAGETIETKTLNGGAYIEDICIDGSCNKSRLTVFFKRPNPDAYISENNPSSYGNSATIKLKSGVSDTYDININVAGMIEIKQD